MANGQLPPYLTSTQPVPTTARAPWYKNTAQTYAGIFLWIAFYDWLAGTPDNPGALGMAGLDVCLMALVVAGLLSHALFYVVPGMLGMRTGLPLYIVGTSTFGTKGGYFLPGIFMGLLQIGWYSVATFYAMYLYNCAFRYLRMGYASAMAWILFIVIMVLTLIFHRLSRRHVYYGG